MALTIWRFILVYVLFGIITFFFIVISFNILRRNIRDRLNQLLSLFHMILVVSMINNFIYASISNPALQHIVEIMHIFSMYLIITASGFLLLFIILLFNPENRFSSTKNQIIFLIIYNLFGIGIFFIPNGVTVKILSDGTQLYPVWNLYFYIYYITILGTNMILSLGITIKIHKKIKIKPLAKRIKLFFIGLCCIYYMGFGLATLHFLNIDTLRNIFTLTQAIPIIGVILIYCGVGKSLKETSQISHQNI